MALVYQCPYCQNYVSILSPHCHRCGRKLPSTLRWIAITTTAFAVAPPIARYFKQAVAKEIDNGSAQASSQVPTDRWVKQTLYKAVLGPCGHYAGVRGDPERLKGKQAYCPGPGCNDAPRKVVRILGPIPGR